MEHGFYATYFEIEDRHWWFVGRRALFLRLLSERVSAELPLELLDFGCGTGTMMRHLDRFGHVRGVDADSEAVEFCRQRGLQNVQLIHNSRLSLGDQSIDVVTALDVLEHIDDDRAALGEMHRVLRPGGTLLIAVPAFPSLWGVQDEISHHRRRYVRSELRDKLMATGFAISRLSYFNTLFLLPIAGIRLFMRLVGPPTKRRSDFELGPPWLNTPLSLAFRAEARVVARWNLPVGVSLVALAERR